MWPFQPIMFSWWQNSSKNVYYASQDITGVYILLHKIIVTCEIFFVYVAWRKICTIMSFSGSLKMFGWRQNNSRSGHFALWGKRDTTWVIKNIGIGHRQWKFKNIGISPKKNRSRSSFYLRRQNRHCKYTSLESIGIGCRPAVIKVWSGRVSPPICRWKHQNFIELAISQ